jgi:aryl-alcohol dehydrogenase-like predicted oxidoreductase
LAEALSFSPSGLELGLGLVSIGRVWGVAETAVPDDAAAQTLLAAAVDGGIRAFDTAPAYGVSETRLGAFLNGLPIATRDRLVVMTKVGEHWNAGAKAAFTDHSFDAMARSLDRSLKLFGRIDVLQLHKATEEAIAAPDTARLFAHARTLGIGTSGASVSSVAAGRLALGTGLFTCLQFPFNADNLPMAPLLDDLEAAGGFPILNRPFAMGAAVHAAADKAAAGVEAFRFLRQRVRRGVVLTGTGKAVHLRENLASFAASGSS